MFKPKASLERKSFVRREEIYFWTATINNWYPLLLDDSYKDVVIESLNYLSSNHKIDVFGFVIMPTHLHFIWRMLKANGKESPHGSFLKYTAHQFQRKLFSEGPGKLEKYRVDRNNKMHEFWQRDSLAIPLFTRHVAYQKLDYIHRNPLAAHWQLTKHASDYKYSSARFYQKGLREFAFLKDLRNEFYY